MCGGRFLKETHAAGKQNGVGEGVDHSDFNRIYNQYYKLVMRAAENFVDDFHYREDVCQEVFAKLYRHMDRVDESYIRPWFLVATRNTALDLRRKLKMDGQIGETPADIDLTDVPSMKDDPEREVLASVYRSEVVKELLKKNPEFDHDEDIPFE